MRKTIMTPASGPAGATGPWLDLASLASVEVSSEDAAHPIEAALLPSAADAPGGWRADGPGPQLVRLRFDAPQRLRRIHLRISDVAEERTQELVLRWSGDGGSSFREIVRQQWTFSPGGATSEVEDYEVRLDAVDVLELGIVPHVGGRAARATLAELRLA